MQISELTQTPKTHQNTEVTIAGIVRATYNLPFPHFLLENESGTLLCRTEINLPWPGAHVEITGPFRFEIPESCNIELPFLNEERRAYVGHPTDTCNLPTCEFATNKPSEVAA